MLNKNTLILASGLALGFASCSKDDNKNDGGNGEVGEGRFIIAAAPTTSGSEGVADYLLTVEDINSGSITTTGNGVEQDGTYRYYTTSGNKFFSMLYGQGNPGAVTVYKLDAKGELEMLTDFKSETVHSFAAVGNDILMVKEGRNYATPTSRWYQVSTESLLIAKEGSFNSTELAANGELAHFSWIKAIGGNKVYAPFFSIKGTTEGGWTTDFPDSAWVAVFNYPAMTLEKVIKDNRTSSIGMYFTDGLAETENGDVYAFSPANTMKKNTDGTQSFNSTKPSAITRIKSGTTEFDLSYYYNVEEAAGGAYITSWINVGNSTVVATFNTPDKKSQWSGANKLAIINLATKNFRWVTGVPDAATITGFSMTNYGKDGIAYIGINTTTAKSAVYKIDANAATATRGVELDGGRITAIQWLPAK